MDFAEASLETSIPNAMEKDSQNIEDAPTASLAVASPKNEDEIDLGPFFRYLQTPQGHEIASRVLQIMEDVKKATIDKGHSQAKFNRWMEAGMLMVVLVAVVVLSCFDKLNPTVGVVLGTLVGYFFGKVK